MWINHFIQVDLSRGRFWMDLCGGRDQVAIRVLQSGWEAHEEPVPRLVASWCETRPIYVIDAGAKTGFYSLLAAASGAKRVIAIEPDARMASVLQTNLRISSLSHIVDVVDNALAEQVHEGILIHPDSRHGFAELSATLNPEYRTGATTERNVKATTLDSVVEMLAPHADSESLLIKLDVETCELTVLAGAEKTLQNFRPALITRVLSEDSFPAWHSWMRRWEYQFHTLGPYAPLIGNAKSEPEVSMTERLNHQCLNYLFLPYESADSWTTGT